MKPTGEQYTLDYTRCRTIAHGYGAEKNNECAAVWWQKAADLAPSQCEKADCMQRKDACSS